MHALSIADGEATGRAAWSDWKAALVSELVAKVKSALTDNTVAQQPEISEPQRLKAEAGELSVILDNRGDVYAIEVIVVDKPGYFPLLQEC